MNIEIKVQDEKLIQQLAKLQHKIGDMSSFFQELGVELERQAHERFSTSTAPDGTPWQSNAETTILHYLNKRSSSNKKSGLFEKGGKLNSKGSQVVMSKKPLVGLSKSLKNIYYQVDGQSVFVGSNMIYAMIQQFGGTKAQFPKLWGDIPARPFLPVKQDGSLYESTDQLIQSVLFNYLNDDNV